VSVGLAGLSLQRSAAAGAHESNNAQVGIWWPAADPARIRAAATAWRDLAGDVDAVSTRATQVVRHVCAENHAGAVTALEAHWTGNWAGSGGYLPAVAGAARELAQALDGYARAVQMAQDRIKELIAAAATAVVVGVALTVVTVGISDVAAEAVAAGLVAAAAAVGVQLSAEAAAIVSAVVVTSAFGALEGGLTDLGIQAERVGCFHEQPGINWQEVAALAGVGALGGAAASRLIPAAAAVAPLGGRITARLAGSAVTVAEDESLAPLGKAAAAGLRRTPRYQLSHSEIRRLKTEFHEIGGDPRQLRFNQGPRTAYSDMDDVIYVRGDVLPPTQPRSAHPRTLLSSRAALAHEVGHAYFRGTKAPPGAWYDEFRASYWAAKNVPGLSSEDRLRLVQDALTRAEEQGTTIKQNTFMREMLSAVGAGHRSAG
jgi:hypothetical protein